MILGYIRVSSMKQELQNQKSTILEVANSKKLIVDKFIEVQVSSRKKETQRKINEIFEQLKSGDGLIVTELSRLGRSVIEVIMIINRLIDQGVRIISIKEHIDMQDTHSMQSKVMITMFGLFAELERDLISQRTKEALAVKKKEGVKLGRPKGTGRSSLDGRKEEIKMLVDKGVSIFSISKIVEKSYPTVYNYVKKHKMKKRKA